MKLVRVHKPGTNKSQLVDPDKIEFYKQYGYEPEVTEEVEVKAVLKPVKKTAKPEPAVEEAAEAVASIQEVGDDTKGE